MSATGNQPTIHVCYSPASYELFKQDDNIVVVIDVLRATSAMVTAFHTGVDRIIPVASVEEAREYKKNGFLVAAERDGMIVDGFELGNSPFCYMGREIKNKTIVITTTNGTKAIKAASQHAGKVIVGAFINHAAVVDYVAKSKKNLLLLCAGWKDKFNLEDTLFAGAVAQRLIEQHNYYTECDSAISSMHLYDSAKANIYKFLENSSHRKRLAKMQLEEDIEYCLSFDKCPVIPILDGNHLVNATK